MPETDSMIDIHCHVLPFVDYDGPQTLEDSLEMLECAQKQGIGVIIATPHVWTSDSRARMEEMEDALVLVKENASKMHLSVDLRLGGEVHVSPDLREFVKATSVSLDGAGRHVLVELPMHEFPPYAQPQLLSLLSEGITPVLAHPERNLKVMRDEGILFPLCRAGVLLQVNSGSLVGSFGREVRKTANSLLSLGLCHFVASDAHNSGNRGFTTREAREAAERVVGEAEAREIFEDNPARLLQRHWR